MKKILLSAAAVAIAVALVGPKVVGSNFSSSIENTVATINSNPAYKASITSIESGWFSTHALVNVGIQLPDMAELGQPALDMSVDIMVHGDHGPIVMTNNGVSLAWLHTQLVTQTNTLPEGLSVNNDTPIYQLMAVTPIVGVTEYSDAVAAMEYVDAETQTTVSFSGMEGQGSLSSASYQGSSNGSSLNINVADALLFDMQNFEIGISAEVSLADMMQQGLYDSSSLIGIESMTITNNLEGSETRINTVLLNAVSMLDESAGTGNVAATTTVASVDANGTMLSELLVNFELNNLEQAFLKAYQEFSSNMMDYASDTNKVAEATQQFLQNNLLSQLQKEPEYNITELSGKINDSEFTGKALAKLTGINTLPTTLEDPAFWMQHTNVDSKLSMQTAAAEFVVTQVLLTQLSGNPNFANLDAEQQAEVLQQQVGPTLEGLVLQGMLVKTDTGYEISFTLENSAAALNGTPIPL